MNEHLNVVERWKMAKEEILLILNSLSEVYERTKKDIKEKCGQELGNSQINMDGYHIELSLQMVEIYREGMVSIKSYNKSYEHWYQSLKQAERTLEFLRRFDLSEVRKAAEKKLLG